MLDDLIKQFEEVKKKVDPLLSQRRELIAIYRDSHSDGVHYLGSNELAWKVQMTGFNTPATPEKLAEALSFYKKEKVSQEEALKLGIKTLEEYYSKAQS
jgi:hypothetical protein